MIYLTNDKRSVTLLLQGCYRVNREWYTFVDVVSLYMLYLSRDTCPT